MQPADFGRLVLNFGARLLDDQMFLINRAKPFPKVMMHPDFAEKN